MCGDMVQVPAAGEGATERVASRRSPIDLVDREPGEVLEVRAFSGQHPYLDPGFDQGARHRTTDKSGCSGDEGFHR